MYVTHFGFRADPFDSASGVACFYPSRAHQRAYLKLVESTCERETISLLTGMAGVGKTTLLKRMCSRAGPRRRFIHFDATNASAEFLFLSRSSLSFDEVLGSVCRDLAVDAEGQAREQRLAALRTVLLQEREAGRAVVLLVDEAQNLSAEILEDLLSLSVAQREAGGSFPVTLAGTPDLVERLWTGRVLRPDHGVALRCELDPLNRDEVGALIRHRLVHYGYRGQTLFEPGAVETVAHYSGGVPRAVNTLCHSALVITCIEQGAVVTREAAEEAAQRTCVDVPDAVIADAVLPDTKTSEPATGKVLVFPRSRTVEPVSPPDPPSREQPAHFLASLQAAVFELASSLLRRWRPSAMLSGLLIAGGIGALLGLMIEGVLQAPVEPPVFPAGDAPVTATAEVSPLSPAGGVDIATSESAEPETGASETAVSLSSGQEVSSSVLAAGGDAPVQSQPGTAASVQPAPAQYARQTESALELFAMLPHVRFDAMTSWPDKRGDGSVELSAEAVASEGDVAALVPAQDLLVDQAADRVGTGRVEIQDDRAGEQSEEIAEHVSPAEFVSLEQRVATLVERARVHEREGRYVEPVADNALDLYREVLGLDAGNDRALQGIAVIKQLYLSRAESAELRSEWALAETSYRTASRIDPRDDGVLVDLARVSELKRGEDQAAARLQQNQQTTRRLARERLAELGLEPNARSLLQAAHVGDLTAADLLLAAGVSPDVVDPFTGTTPLIAAAMRGRTDIVLSLAQADASIDRRDAKGRTATMWAVDNSHAETVSLLLALGADAETRSDAGETLLMYSAWNGDVETSRILLDSGADASAASRSGWTALMNAAISGHAEIVELLLQRTADVNARNSEGRTALMAAASNGHTQIVRLLLSKAADVSLSKTDGWTALMYAAWNGHSTIVALLVAGGAQVDAANKDGWTALMYAAWNGHTATVSTLLAARADPQRRNRQGRTALMEARDQGHREVVKMLLSVANRVSANLPDAAGLNLCADDRIVNCDLLSDSL